jgi:hypothetical protein
MNWIYSPFIIPLAGISVAIVAIISGAVSQMHNSRLKAEQRMAMLARGIPMAEIEAVLQAPRSPTLRSQRIPCARSATLAAPPWF